MPPPPPPYFVSWCFRNPLAKKRPKNKTKKSKETISLRSDLNPNKPNRRFPLIALGTGFSEKKGEKRHGRTFYASWRGCASFSLFIFLAAPRHSLLSSSLVARCTLPFFCIAFGTDRTFAATSSAAAVAAVPSVPPVLSSGFWRPT
jgi:hypothetical protein